MQNNLDALANTALSELGTAQPQFVYYYTSSTILLFNHSNNQTSNDKVGRVTKSWFMF